MNFYLIYPNLKTASFTEIHFLHQNLSRAVFKGAIRQESDYALKNEIED